MRDRIKDLTVSIARLEAIAAEQAMVAAQLNEGPAAEVMRDTARSHRARAREMRAELSMLEARQVAKVSEPQRRSD